MLGPQMKRIAKYAHIRALASTACPQQPSLDDIAEAPLAKRQTGESTGSAALQYLQRGATTDDSASANDFHHYLLAPVDSGCECCTMVARK